jgi:hypothetical protein
MAIQQRAKIEFAHRLIDTTHAKYRNISRHSQHADLHAMRGMYRQVIRWAVDVDPMAI